MKILVLMKAVPSISGGYEDCDRQKTELIENPADLTALEEALFLRDTLGAEVTLLTMGIERCASLLRQGLARGADHAVLLSDPAFAGSDTCATARILAAAVTYLKGFNLIFCGRKSIDGETGQVGPELAAHLRLPCISNCMTFSMKDVYAHCVCLTDFGSEALSCPIPALITFCNGINSPRLSSLSGLFRANQADILRINSKMLGLSRDVCGQAGSPTAVKRSTRCPFEKRHAVRINDGQLDRAAILLGAAIGKEPKHG